ncbi:conserved hypothetical protein [Altererythrobacter sp. B11]|uniref:hypothetical protein n=1 Tax=Altererythrobacter sp. B11 TaxID=2060312 RepID=UPI000DC6D253|nr:hypothetical protein [Altererythrobacter sp. B11]BBC72753.1 conserved hypothetical protein [Altererythrobacter sp. B11]
MRRRLHLALVLTPLPALLAHSAFAQDAVQMPLFGGALLFRGDVGVTRDERSADRVNMEFWRPLTFGPADRPIGGRMDCQLAGVEQPFTADSFDLKSRYEASIPQRKRAGLKDDAVVSDGAGEINHLQVSGAANNPTATTCSPISRCAASTGSTTCA